MINKISLLQQPGAKKFKLLKIELIYKGSLKFPRSLSKKCTYKAQLCKLSYLNPGTLNHEIFYTEYAPVQGAIATRPVWYNLLRFRGLWGSLGLRWLYLKGHGTK